MEELSRYSWAERGKSLFGKNVLNWRFRCPACNGVQTGNEFKQFFSLGAAPQMSYTKCLSHYAGGGCLFEAETGHDDLIQMKENGVTILSFPFDE